MTPLRNSAAEKGDEKHSGDGDRGPGGPAGLLITSPVTGAGFLTSILASSSVKQR